MAAGLYDCDGTIENNTIADNSADWAGGLADCGGTIRNCIIWGNEPVSGPQIITPGPDQPTYSCIQDWEGEGVGNVAYFPYFVDLEAGDYHLRTWSPCTTPAGLSRSAGR